MCSAYSITFIIIYLNLLNMGYSFNEYLSFICTKYECISLIIGIILIVCSFIRKKDKNV